MRLSEKILHHQQAPGLVKRQIQVFQKPRLGWPSQNHEEKMDIGLTQLGKDLGEKLMRREGISPQDLPWQKNGPSTRESGAEDIKVGAWCSSWWRRD